MADKPAPTLHRAVTGSRTVLEEGVGMPRRTRCIAAFYREELAMPQRFGLEIRNGFAPCLPALPT
jgi:hypothetical protein